MASRYGVVGILVMMLLLLMSASADLAKDRQECTDELVGLATCLPYVGGEGKAPTVECCVGLKQVLQKSKKCLCLLIKDHDDPDLGLKINVTIALGLPSACHAPTNISDCPALLQLAPGSPDAKIFEDYAKSIAATTSALAPTVSAKANSTSSGSSSSEKKNNAGKSRGWAGGEMTFGLLLIVSYLLLISSPFEI